MSQDPFEVFLAPPPNETPEEKARRKEEERVQRQRNIEIEDMLREEKAKIKANKQLRVLLVGQSESGKSTILKNFRLTFSPRAFRAERATWITIIYLNIVRAVNIICQNLADELESLSSPDPDPINVFSKAASHIVDMHRELLTRLNPLRDVEIRLRGQIAPPSDSQQFEPGSKRSHEFFVRSGSAWQRYWSTAASNAERDRNSQELEQRRNRDNEEVLMKLLDCRIDVERLWSSPEVKSMLQCRKAKLEESASFYLNNVERIIDRYYEPTDDDVIRARLRTVGVQEYRITPEKELPKEVDREWLLYDVGGSRSQRAAWVPFFEHMNAIIFIAPVNCFNEKLAEDKSKNRLEDSFELYKVVISSDLLFNVQIILFLNKIDLLSRHIEDGIQIKKYIPSYGDKPNDVENVTRYLLKKFRDICKQFAPKPRLFYAYRTSAVDIVNTANTLTIVRDGILRTQLESATLL